MPGTSHCRNCEAAVPDDGVFCHVCGTEIASDATLEPHARLRERLAAALGDRYRLLDVLGEGGMGVVFLAEDLELQHKKVAIKVLSPDMAADPSIVERFAREAKTAAALEHSGIVRIYDYGRERGLHYFVMQYVEGRTLQSLLKDQPRLPIRMASRILRDAAAALAHAHRRGVVHRDVKPENIMLDANGRVLLADFGISKTSRATNDAKTVVKLTETGGVIGTPHYMAPEHALGQAVDGRTDQYALGVVGFQMLAGQLPFDEATPAAIIHLHINSAAPRLSSLRPDVPPQLAAAIARAMSKAPSHRFDSMEELAAAVEQPTAGRPALARAVASVIALLIVAGLGGGAWWWMAQRNPTAPLAPTVAVQGSETAPARADTSKGATTKSPSAKVAPAQAVPAQAAPAKAAPTKSATTKAATTKAATTKSATTAAAPTKPAITAGAPLPRHMARLSITASPNATVFINGKSIGLTPIAEHPLRIGKHQLRLERQGYRARFDTIRVYTAGAMQRSYVLQRTPRN